jgi:CO/xanthine dehydrogenase FAD-binding subunit
VKPPSFEYHAPRTVDEVVARLAEHGDGAKVLAGGQSLVPLMNLRLAAPEVLVDVNRVDGLAGLSAWDGGVSIGSLVRQSALERSELARERLPLLAEAIRYVGHPTIRHRGTVGGSLAHADPAAELPAAMLALEATLVARGPGGDREIPAADFFTGYLTTALAPDELLTEVRVPGVPDGTGAAFVELSRRYGDFAICGAAALVTLDDAGRCTRARVALCGVGAGPIRARTVEDALLNEKPEGEALEAAAQRAVDEIDPPSDVHGSAAYRRKIAVVMTRRALALAAERAGRSDA